MRVEKWRTKSNIKIMKIPNWQCRTVKPTLELRVIWYFIYPQSLAVSNSTDFNSGVVHKNYITHVKQSSKQGNKVQCKTVHSSRRRYKKKALFFWQNLTKATICQSTATVIKQNKTDQTPSQSVINCPGDMSVYFLQRNGRKTKLNDELDKQQLERQSSWCYR